MLPNFEKGTKRRQSGKLRKEWDDDDRRNSN